MTRRPPKTSPLGRLFELGSLAARAGASTAASYISGLGRPAATREALRLEELVRNARRLVATLGDMKGAAMKVGQMLSLQDAFLPPEVAVVLRSLQGETPSLPLEMVEDQLASELGDPLQLFASFEPEALAAASIGQVHRAVLRDGRRVAVKIQYPDIDRIVEADLGNLRRVLKGVVALISKVDFEPIWKELQARLREAGFAVDVSADGEEGLWYAESCDYDVIILDLMLPGLSGLDVCARLGEGRVGVSTESDWPFRAPSE